MHASRNSRLSLPCLRLLLPALLLVASLASNWPNCQQQLRVFRHNGGNGLFVDLAAAVGAKEGCWLNDCTKTDKFVCPSVADCALACSRVEACRFWSYEPAIVKCFLRRSDDGREDHPDFVSGARACHPLTANSGVAVTHTAAAGLGTATRVRVPFARTALWAAELSVIHACDDGIDAVGCENPYGAMGVWRYAVNNLRAALLYSQELGEARPYVQQLSADLARFYQQPTGESFQVAVRNANAIFSELKPYLETASDSELVVRDEGRGGAPHLPDGRSAQVNSGLATLTDGWQMPVVGFGTWQLVGQAAYESTLAALRIGYRHIDTAQAYMNEREVGLAIRDSGVPRNELFLATKISDPAAYPRLAELLDQQLAALGTDYLDLYMLHTPGDDQASTLAAWRTLEQLQQRGVVRSLGVSNFGPAQLDELIAAAQVRPVYVQNKFSVYNPGEQQVGTTSVMAHLRERGVQMMGYSVINPWPMLLPPMEDPHVRAVAARCGRAPSQVLHRWALQLGAAVIPKSATPARMEENAKIFDFHLSEVDMRLLNGLVTLSESVPGSAAAPAWVEDIYGMQGVVGPAA